MLLGVCSKCKASSLPVREGVLAAHFDNSKLCTNSVPGETYPSTTPCYINNPSLTFFEQMKAMLELLEEK